MFFEMVVFVFVYFIYRRPHSSPLALALTLALTVTPALTPPRPLTLVPTLTHTLLPHSPLHALNGFDSLIVTFASKHSHLGWCHPVCLLWIGLVWLDLFVCLLAQAHVAFLSLSPPPPLLLTALTPFCSVALVHRRECTRRHRQRFGGGDDNGSNVVGWCPIFFCVCVFFACSLAWLFVCFSVCLFIGIFVCLFVFCLLISLFDYLFVVSLFFFLGFVSLCVCWFVYL